MLTETPYLYLVVYYIVSRVLFTLWIIASYGVQYYTGWLNSADIPHMAQNKIRALPHNSVEPWYIVFVPLFGDIWIAGAIIYSVVFAHEFIIGYWAMKFQQRRNYILAARDSYSLNSSPQGHLREWEPDENSSNPN